MSYPTTSTGSTSTGSGNSSSSGSHCPFYPSENILFFLDLCEEMQGLEFATTSSSSSGGGGDRQQLVLSRFEAIKKCLTFFVHCKSKLGNGQHTFGLCVLAQEAFEVIPATSNAQAFCSQLTALQPFSESFPTLDMASLFQLCETKLSTPTLLRAILIYGKSNIYPSNLTSSAAVYCLSHANFYLDILYLHKKPSTMAASMETLEQAKIMLQQIYDLLTVGLRPTNGHESYSFEVSGNFRRVSWYFSQLLAHAKQRPVLENFHSTLHPPPPPSTSTTATAAAAATTTTITSNSSSSSSSSSTHVPVSVPLRVPISDTSPSLPPTAIAPVEVSIAPLPPTKDQTAVEDPIVAFLTTPTPTLSTVSTTTAATTASATSTTTASAPPTTILPPRNPLLPPPLPTLNTTVEGSSSTSSSSCCSSSSSSSSTSSTSPSSPSPTMMI